MVDILSDPEMIGFRKRSLREREIYSNNLEDHKLDYISMDKVAQVGCVLYIRNEEKVKV